METNELRKTMRKVLAGLSGLFVVGVLFISPYISSENEGGVTNTTTPSNSNNSTSKERRDTYMEDKTNDDNKITIPAKKKEQIEKSLEEFNNNKDSMENKNPNLLKINNQYFYLFDENILLPTDTSTWNQYDISGASDGSYSKISEFYVEGENPKSWTQKLSIHAVKMDNKDCFIMADKIVNGIIMNISDQLEANDIQLEKDMLSFNYVKKESNDTLLYWERKNILDIQPETQFMRVFLSEYSNNMYLVTYTLKQDFASIKDSDITSYLQTLASIQELKKK